MAGLLTVRTRIQKNTSKVLECLQSLSEMTQSDQKIEQLQARIEAQQQELRQRLLNAIHQTEVTLAEPLHTLTVEPFIKMMADIHKAHSLQRLQTLFKRHEVPLYTVFPHRLSQTASVRYNLFVRMDTGVVPSIQGQGTHCCLDKRILNYTVSIPEILLQAECATVSACPHDPVLSVRTLKKRKKHWLTLHYKIFSSPQTCQSLQERVLR